jgi:hypothetical protein
VTSPATHSRPSPLANHAGLARRWAILALVVLPFSLIAGCGGCDDSSTSVLPGGPGGVSTPQQTTQGLLDIAIDNLDRQEEFPPFQMLPQIVDQLNQWIRTQQAPSDWKPDPALDTLPQPLAAVPELEGLDQLRFPPSDQFALQEAAWLRNVSRWAAGNQLDDLHQTIRLFDWTVRNIQLADIAELESGQRFMQMPWETLLLGQGTAAERACVFILLARQLGLDAALLALPDPDDPQAGPPRPWAVGVLIDDQVYVFDPGLGLPIPAPDGIRLDQGRKLAIQPATLAQLADDESLLRRLDLDAQRPYQVTSAEMGQVVALVEASPAYLALRMKLVQSHLLGRRRVVLSASATEQIDRWKQATGIADAQLWVFPYLVLLDRQNVPEQQRSQQAAAMLPFYMTYAAPIWQGEADGPLPWEDEAFYQPRRTASSKDVEETPLWKARILHLKGQFSGPTGAIHFYLDARPSDEQLAGLADIYYQIFLGELGVAPGNETQQQRLDATDFAKQRVAFYEPFFRRAKQDASYWLGLLNFDLALIALDQQDTDQNDPDSAAEHYRTALDYLRTRTLKASPDGPWTHGAYYNLARTHEATGDLDEAITYYILDADSPTHYGNLLRARWLDKLRPEADQPER